MAAFAQESVQLLLTHSDLMAGGGVAEFLTTADVAALLGVDAATIRSYRAMSKPGTRYAGHPFPAPDMTIGRMPIWSGTRIDELRQWAVSRRGPGRPRKE